MFSWGVALVCLLTTSPLAQPTIDAGNSQSLELRVANLEQQYDSQIIQILANYFDRKKFFVDVNINAELVDEAIGSSQNQVVRNNTSSALFMPGLPYLPEDNLRQQSSIDIEPDTYLNQNTIKTLRLNNLTVNVYADTSLKADQLELLRFITRIAVKLNEDRGDLITISQLAIPDYTQKPEPVTAASIAPTSTSPVYDSIFTYIPGIVLMLLFGLTLVFSRFINKPQQIVIGKEARDALREETPTISLYKPNLSPHEQAESMMADSSAEKQEKEHTKIPGLPSIDQIVKVFFQKPGEVTSIFKFWLTDVEDGDVKAARVIAAVDTQLLRTIKKYLHPEDFETLTEAVKNLGELSRVDKEEIIMEFNAMLQAGARETIANEKRESFGLFKFLDHIPDHHILTLIETDEPIAGAFILQYLPEIKAAEYLEKLDRDTAAQIMLHMASLNNLSKAEQQRISSELFDKAMDLVEADRNEQYGAEHLLPILERLPIFEQKKYIEELKSTGSVVGAILEKQFITIEKIPELSEDIIQESVQKLKTETLLDALIGLDEASINKLLSGRPNREQKLLRLELKEMQDTPIQHTEYAKVLLMNYIRKNSKK